MIARLLLVTGLVVIADQLSKWLVTRSLAPGQARQIGPLIRIKLVTNTRGGPGLLQNRSLLLLLWSLAMFGAIILVWHGGLVRGMAATVGLGAALGGAAGNLIDWLRRGAIIDFIDLGFWPVFNVADATIVVGLVVAFCFGRVAGF